MTTRHPEPADPIVTIDSGRVSGRWRGASAAFLGIPYAAAPVGPRRFAAPGPVEPWDGIRDAATFGPTPQRRPLAPVTRIPEPSIPGEETLNVNVFTPAPGDAAAGLPVLVWIHGGGYTAGSPASSWWDGAAFNAAGVVTVTLSYRLGFDGYGWLADAPSNRAVRDQIAALEWVRRNITRFGGDPAKVTIAGQSAGGGSALALLVSPLARGLFRGVIAQSAALPKLTEADGRALGERLALAAGVPPTRAGWASVAEERILDLQGQVLAESMRAMTNLGALLRGEARMALPFGPVCGDDVLPTTLKDALARGVGADVALLVGANSGELAPETLTDELRSEPLDPAALTRLGLPAALIERYRRAHPGYGTARLIGQITTDAVFRIPLRQWVDLRSGRGAGSADAGPADGGRAGLAADASPTWVYEFAWCSPVSGTSVHCAELPFVWHNLAGEGVRALLGDEPPAQLAAATHGAWVRFVRDLEPGWSRYAADERIGRVFDAPVRDAADAYGDASAVAVALSH